MTDIDKLIAQLKAHAEAWEVKGTDNRNELIGEQVMAFDCLTALEEIQRLRAIEAAARAYCDLTPKRADETPAPLLFSRLQAALAAKDMV
jgi:hypothetical protein